MNRQKAIEYLSEGHSLWKVETAREICEAVGIEFKDSLIFRWKNQKDANPDNHPKGLWLNEPDKAGEGVESLRLSNYVVNALGLEVHGFMGRGFQAQANARAIKAKFEKEEVA